MPKGDISIRTVRPGARFAAREIAQTGPSGLWLTSTADSYLAAVVRSLPDGCEVEAVTLSQCMRKLLFMTGETCAQAATQGQTRFAVSRCSEQVARGTMFEASAGFSGMHRALVRTLHELRWAGCTPEALRNVCSSVPARTGEKLAVLADLDEAITAVLSDIGRERAADRARRLLDGRIPKGGAPENVWVLAHEPTSLLIQVLQWLAAQGAKVVVLVPTGDMSRAEESRASRFASSLAIDEPDMPPGAHWTDALFSQAVSSQNAPEVTIGRAPDPISECEWVLRACLRAARAGVPLARMAILARESDLYAPLLQAAAGRLEVPVRTSAHMPLLGSAFARILVTALEFVATASPAALATLVESSYSNVDSASISRVLSRLRDLGNLARYPRDLLPKALATLEPDAPWIQRLCLRRLELLQVRHTPAKWSETLRTLMGDMPWIDSAVDEGSPAKLRDNAAMTACQRAPKEFAEVHLKGDSVTWTLGEFRDQMLKLWSDEQISWPMREQGIQFATSENELPDVDRLYVLGMLEGVLPSRRTEDPVLFDSDRAALNSVSDPTSRIPLSREQMAAERDVLVQLCATPAESLWLTYPEADEEREQTPAFYLDEVARVLGGNVQRVHWPRTSFAPDGPECIARADAVLASALEDQAVRPARCMLRTDPAKMAIRPGVEIEVGELGLTLTCPFRSACSFRLPVESRSGRASWNRLVRLPIDARLAEQPDESSARVALEEALHAELARQSDRLQDWEKYVLLTGGKRLINGWLKREFASRSMWRAGVQDHVNVSLEVPELKREYKLGERLIRLAGNVAALGSIGPYSVIRLYEQSTPDFASHASDFVRLGALLLVQHGRSMALGLEVDSIDGNRSLFALPRVPGDELRNHSVSHIQVKALPESAESHLTVKAAKDAFFRDLKAHMTASVELLDAAEMRPTPGDHCRSCGYGELCRSSTEFGDLTVEEQHES